MTLRVCIALLQPLALAWAPRAGARGARARPLAQLGAARLHASPAEDLFGLRDRVVVVTGASSGIGHELAESLAHHGARVVAVARRAERLEALSARVAAGGGSVTPLAADLVAEFRAGTLESGLGARLEAAGGGRVDALVNCAGVNLRERAADVTPASWAETLDLHLAVPFFLARALVPGMAARGVCGKIVNVASLQSYRAMPDSVPYGAAKGGVLQLTRAMAEAWGPQNVCANAIGPGFFETELTAPVFADAERATGLAARTTLGRNGRTRDLVGATVFLCSAASDYITGQTLMVDGGFTAK